MDTDIKKQRTPRKLKPDNIKERIQKLELEEKIELKKFIEDSIEKEKILLQAKLDLIGRNGKD